MKKSFPVLVTLLRPSIAPQCTSQICTKREEAKFCAYTLTSKEGMDKAIGTTKEEHDEAWVLLEHAQMTDNYTLFKGNYLCISCINSLIKDFTHDRTRKTDVMLGLAMMQGCDIMLYDVNFSKTYSNPAMAVGKFTTLQRFREIVAEQYMSKEEWDRTSYKIMFKN